MVNAVLSSKDHSGQVAELQYRIVKQTKMIGLVGNIIKAYDDKDAEAADDSAYIHAVDEALDYLRSINPENKMASEPERAADKMLWDMWYAYMSSECRCYQGHMPRTGRRDVLAQAEAEAKKRLLMDYRMLESRIGHANEMLNFERRCSGSGVSLRLIHGKRRPSPVEAMPTPVPMLAMA